MKYPTTLIIAALFCKTAVAATEPVTCDSPCDCNNAHGEGRWSVKTDSSLPPMDARLIQAVTFQKSSHEHIELSSKSSSSCYTCAPTTDHRRLITSSRRGGRAVDRAGLENRKAERPRE